jgi:hypothetical protein
MFEKFKYLWETNGFFNPEKHDSVSRDEFLKILKGQIRNPLKLKKIDSGEYSFMVVGIQQNVFLDHWASGKWGINGYSTAQKNSYWYMRVSSDGKSKIAIPSKKLVLGIDPFVLSNSEKVFPHRTNVAPYLLGEEMNIREDSENKTLLSMMNVIDLSNCIDEVYPVSSYLGFFKL